MDLKYFQKRLGFLRGREAYLKYIGKYHHKDVSVTDIDDSFINNKKKYV